MPLPNIPEPIAAAQRVKDIARDLASDVTEGYRKSTRGFRLRAAIVGAWAVLSLASVATAVYTHEREGATITDTFVGRIVSLKNTSDENWLDVTLTIEGGWTHFVRTIRPGQELGVDVTKFARDGTHAPRELNPRWIEVECGQASKRLEIRKQ